VKISPRWSLVRAHQVANLWGMCAPWLMQAIGGVDDWGEVETIHTGLTLGRLQMWLVQNAEDNDLLGVIVTEPQQVGRANTLVVRWMGGRRIDDWLSDIGVIERWAQIQGFEAVEIWGRPGWSRRMAPHGYKEDFRVLSKRVSKELH
jgi:hypothetical protein